MQLHVFPLLARLAMKTDDSSPSMSPMVTHRSAHVTIVLKKKVLLRTFPQSLAVCCPWASNSGAPRCNRLSTPTPRSRPSRRLWWARASRTSTMSWSASRIRVITCVRVIHAHREEERRR